MIYEDLLYLWLAFLIYEFFPEKTFSLPLFVFILKEIFFFVLVIFLRIRIRYLEIYEFFGHFLIFLAFIFYILDLTFFSIKSFLDRYYFSSLLGFFWFLHYFLIVRFIFFSFSFTYFKILIGLISPILLLVIIEDLFKTFSLNLGTLEFVLILFLILTFAPIFMVRIWPVKPIDNSYIKEVILNFFKAYKVKIREVYILEDIGKKIYTAGVIGILPKFKYIFFSRPLLNILNIEEIIGVLAHELGHIKNRHAFWLLLLLINLPIILNSLFLLIIFLSSLLGYNMIFFLHNLDRIYRELLFFVYIILVSYVYLRYIFGYFLRQFEREADFYSLMVIEDPHPLISALLKIGEVTGQLYKKSWHHYGLAERIEFLEKASNQRLFFKSHHQRIRILILFLILINLIISLVLSYFYSVELKL